LRFYSPGQLTIKTSVFARLDTGLHVWLYSAIRHNVLARIIKLDVSLYPIQVQIVLETFTLKFSKLSHHVLVMGRINNQLYY